MPKEAKIRENDEHKNWSQLFGKNKVAEGAELTQHKNTHIPDEGKKSLQSIVEGVTQVLYEDVKKGAQVFVKGNKKPPRVVLNKRKSSGQGKPPAEAVSSITQQDWGTLILEDIESKSSYFSSLLNLTDSLIASGQFRHEDAEQLVQRWEYAFTIGKCDGLSHELALLRDNEDVKAQLSGLMQLFNHFGLKKLDIQNSITVSPENRLYFDNGTQFPDGTVCAIARWPWLYKEKVYYRGMLCKLENEQVLL